MPNLRLVKAKQLSRRVAAIWLRDSVAPIFNRQELYQLVQLPIFLFLVFIATGSAKMTGEELGVWQAGKLALIYALPFYLVINLIVAPFRAKREIKEEGVWVGDKFIYHTPQHLLTCSVSERDNGDVKAFKVKGVEKGSLVDTNVEFNRRDNRVKALVESNSNFDQVPIGWQVVGRHTKATSRLPMDGKMYLHTSVEPETDETIVRVFLNAWRP